MSGIADVTVRDGGRWLATDYPTKDSFSLPLDSAMTGELADAARKAERSGRPFEAITADDFPLPRLAPLLDEAFDILEDGRGFVLLRGLPVEELGRDTSIFALAGLSTHLGVLVDQTVRRNRIEEIIDRERPFDHTSRGYSSNKWLPFHTDGSDFAGLLCLGAAAEGGQSLLASAAAVHAAIAAERPDLAAVLERGLYHHRRGEQAEGEPAVLPERQPVFWTMQGRMHVFYNRNPPAWLEPEGITVTPEEIAAQDLLDEVLERPEIQLRMFLEPGDLQIINNYSVLHSRKEYRDGPGRKRHLLRVWIRSKAPRHAGPNIIDLYAPWESRHALPQPETTGARP